MSLATVFHTAPARQAPPSDRLSPISADLLRGPGRLLRISLAGLAALVLVFMVWAHFAVLDEVAVGMGKVIPAGKVQLVQNLEGGIVRQIAAREGARVKAGDLLVRIDDTGIGATLEERREKAFGLMALIARLDAEMTGSPFAPPAELVERQPALVAQHRSLIETRKREFSATLNVLDAQIEQRGNEIEETRIKIANLEKAFEFVREERDLTAPLVQRGSAARVELIRIDSRLNEIEGGLAAARAAMPRLEAAHGEARDRKREKENAHRSDILTQLNEAKVQLASLEQGMRGESDKLSRADIRAPVDGIVKTVHVNTIGQIVKPGMDIVEIVPLRDQLLIEARVRPQDIAFIRPGQDATVKVTAYDFAIYGGLAGKVERLGADSITDQRGETYYLVQIRTDRNHLEHGGEQLFITPGMVAQADVLTGRKSVLDYLIKPITRMRMQALRER